MAVGTYSTEKPTTLMVTHTTSSVDLIREAPYPTTPHDWIAGTRYRIVSTVKRSDGIGGKTKLMHKKRRSWVCSLHLRILHACLGQSPRNDHPCLQATLSSDVSIIGITADLNSSLSPIVRLGCQSCIAKMEKCCSSFYLAQVRAGKDRLFNLHPGRSIIKTTHLFPYTRPST